MEERRWNRLLRSALGWPFVWRWAYNIIVKLDHVESPHCLVCAAKLRKLKFTHEPSIGYDRQVRCSKCGLHLSKWKSQHRCPGRRPAPPLVVKKPDFIIFHTNWD